MRIAQVAPLFESVPPRLYGGTERVVSYLTEELVAQGHEVTLFASADSHTRGAAGRRRARARCGSMPPASTAWRLTSSCSRRSCAQAARFDVIHFHVDYLHFPLVAPARDAARHARCTGGSTSPTRPLYRRVHRHAARLDLRRPAPAAAQAQLAGDRPPRPAADAAAASAERRAATSRSSGASRPRSGAERAIEIARAAGMPLKIAAKVDGADREYFETMIEPLLDPARRVHRRDRRAREGASSSATRCALLFPIDWPEPFGLVMVEAMACGTPVMAFAAARCPR